MKRPSSIHSSGAAGKVFPAVLFALAILLTACHDPGPSFGSERLHGVADFLVVENSSSNDPYGAWGTFLIDSQEYSLDIYLATPGEVNAHVRFSRTDVITPQSLLFLGTSEGYVFTENNVAFSMTVEFQSWADRDDSKGVTELVIDFLPESRLVLLQYGNSRDVPRLASDWEFLNRRMEKVLGDYMDYNGNGPLPVSAILSRPSRPFNRFQETQ